MKISLVAILSVACLTTNSANAFLPSPQAGNSKKLFQPPSNSLMIQTRNTNTQLHGFLADLFPKKEAAVKKEPVVFEPVVIDPDFRIAGLFLTAGAILDCIPYIQLTLGPAVTALGVLFLVQTFRIRFVFDETAFELKTGNDLADSGENVIVGGANRWDTDTIVNYEFFPVGWIDQGLPPILVYFKETATPSESWNEGPGKSANDPDKIAAGEAVAGQVHFFPTVCNAEQIRNEFQRRGCGKL